MKETIVLDIVQQDIYTRHSCLRASTLHPAYPLELQSCHQALMGAGVLTEAEVVLIHDLYLLQKADGRDGRWLTVAM